MSRRKKETQASVTRCAVYTRKSTSEGLEQEFNTLDAQREAAEAFIASQKHEGWSCLPDSYDDGGFSGGNMDRPALTRLLKDIDDGKIDCVVVYKVDRLSRSLLDFARIMGIFEKRGVAFVSVTQQFNTSSSMGRLMLNILLSFAQFEREMISERTRDKMSAARRKGKYAGGSPVLGYDVDRNPLRLVVNESEARQVRGIFELYLEKGSLIETVQELARRGWTTKRWRTKKDIERGGRIFTKTNLSSLLSNVTYLGKVRHHDEVFEGEHDAIVDEKLWNSVQRQLRQNFRGVDKDSRNKYGALLRGILYCASCQAAMSHTLSSTRGNKCYRYYVCTSAQKRGWDVCPTKSLSAGEIEDFVVERIRCIGKDRLLLRETLMRADQQRSKHCDELNAELRRLDSNLRRDNTEIRSLSEMSSQSENSGSRVGRLAELHDRIRMDEQRGTSLRQELAALEGTMINQKELVTALRLFDPVWEVLHQRERVRLIHLLIERVEYDGEEGTISLAFRPAGIKTLASEYGAAGQTGQTS